MTCFRGKTFQVINYLFSQSVVGTVSRLIPKVEVLIFWWLKGAWNKSGKETVREKKKRCSKKAPIKNSLSFHDGAIQLNVYFTWQWFITRETKRFFPGLFDFATVWQIKNLWEILLANGNHHFKMGSLDPKKAIFQWANTQYSTQSLLKINHLVPQLVAGKLTSYVRNHGFKFSSGVALFLTMIHCSTLANCVLEFSSAVPFKFISRQQSSCKTTRCEKKVVNRL